jgi:hypothetical protein
MAAFSKLLVHLSVIAGLFTASWLGAREWAPLFWLTVMALAAGFVLVRVLPVWGWFPILVAAYFFPAIFWATRGFFTFSYYSIFLAGVMGGILASGHPLRWALPAAWRLPLAFWALVLALGWPVLAMRELNYIWAALGSNTLVNGNSGLGGPPAVIIITMLVSVLPQIIGILWFDAMFAAFPRDTPERFRRAILLPLSVGLILSCLLAIYQWLFDLHFLSSHQWPFYKRAAGGLLDGNASGQLFGLWSAAALTWGLAGGWAQILIGLGIAMLTWLGMWGTGSRMALLAAIVGLGAAVYAVLRGDRRRIGYGKIAGGVGGLVALAVLLGVVARFETDPITRTLNELPKTDRASLEKFVEFQFWNRFGPFGTSSLRMFKDSPVVGVGPGTFEPIYVDYAYVVTNGRTRSHFDNAQNWFRHQLVELGVAGSLGWILWVGMFAVFVWKSAPAREGLTEATGVKAAIIALALMSLISMPARNIFVAISFWVFAYWLVMLGRDVVGPRWLSEPAERPIGWTVVLVAALAFVGASGWYGSRYLRPPHRAMMANWDYVNGVSRPVTTPDGIIRYTQERGVAVFPARPNAFLKLSLQVAHPDAASSPVRVKVYQGDVPVAHFVISDRNWHDLYIKVPPDAPNRMLLQLTVDHPAAGAAVPARGLILKDWEFVDVPPRGAIIAQWSDAR